MYTELKQKRIGLVGLGRMGANMARRMADCGYQISSLYDLRKDIAEELATELNATACPRLSDVTAGSEIIFTIVSDDTAMERIFFGHDNLLAGAAGRLFLNCATLTPDVHRKIETAAHAVGAQSLEACMASSIPQARQGQLYLMLGGQRTAFDAVEPLLRDLSKDLLYLGEAGRAAEVKALVNMVMNINTAALAEGLGLGQALGLDLEVLKKVFSQTGANSRVLETDADDMIARDHDCYFSSAHAAKDSGIALNLGKAAGLQLPLAEATLAQYQRMIAAGLGELDKSGIAELTFPGRLAKSP